MINRVTLVGRLTKDPQIRYTPNGVAVTNFTLAVGRRFKQENGDREADFINIVVWKKTAENVATYMKKGSLIGVDGRIQTRNFDGQDGKRVYVTEVVGETVQFLESRNQGGSNQRPSANNNEYNNHSNNNHSNNQNNNNHPANNAGANDTSLDIGDEMYGGEDGMFDDLPF